MPVKTLQVSAKSEASKKEAFKIVDAIEKLCDGKLFCFYQNQGIEENIGRDICFEDSQFIRDTRAQEEDNYFSRFARR